VHASMLTSRLNSVAMAATHQSVGVVNMATHAVAAAGEMQTLVGMAALAFGVLALAGVEMMTMVPVSILLIGASVLLTGAALNAKMVSMFHFED